MAAAWEAGDARSPGPTPARWRWTVVLLRPAGSPGSLGGARRCGAPGSGLQWQVSRQGPAEVGEGGRSSTLPPFRHVYGIPSALRCLSS